ncbi:LOW QUALITY PROTEIN: hypothetical protein M514_10129, partial [Trichuris suis]
MSVSKSSGGRLVDCCPVVSALSPALLVIMVELTMLPTELCFRFLICLCRSLTTINFGKKGEDKASTKLTFGMTALKEKDKNIIAKMMANMSENCVSSSIHKDIHELVTTAVAGTNRFKKQKPERRFNITQNLATLNSPETTDHLSFTLARSSCRK